MIKTTRLFGVCAIAAVARVAVARAIVFRVLPLLLPLLLVVRRAMMRPSDSEPMLAELVHAAGEARMANAPSAPS